MSYFKSRSTKKITLPSNKNYWVEIITDLKYGDLKHLGTLDSDNIEFSSTADKFLEVIIKDWNLDTEAGEKAPFTTEYFDLLEKDDVLMILQEANAVVVEDQGLKDDSSKQ